MFISSSLGVGVVQGGHLVEAVNQTTSTKRDLYLCVQKDKEIEKKRARSAPKGRSTTNARPSISFECAET